MNGLENKWIRLWFCSRQWMRHMSIDLEQTRKMKRKRLYKRREYTKDGMAQARVYSMFAHCLDFGDISWWVNGGRSSREDKRAFFFFFFFRIASREKFNKKNIQNDVKRECSARHVAANTTRTCCAQRFVFAATVSIALTAPLSVHPPTPCPQVPVSLNRTSYRSDRSYIIDFNFLTLGRFTYVINVIVLYYCMHICLILGSN